MIFSVRMLYNKRNGPPSGKGEGGKSGFEARKGGKEKMKFVFSDGEKIGVYRDGNAEKSESVYIAHYRETAIRDSKNKEWKTQGHTAQLLAEGIYTNGEERVVAAIHGVSLTPDENRVLYAFTVNDSSGIYSKLTDDEKKTEMHIVSSNEADFMSVACNGRGEMLAAVQTDPVTSRIAVFQKDSGDYKCVTGGDSLDENPSFGADGKSVLFNSYGVGRDANNNFVEYMPSEIYRLNLSTLDVDPVKSDPKLSYIKPVEDREGNLYCIRKPGKEKTGGNPVVEILLIPVRIIQAIAGFISSFVMCFTGKPLVSGQSSRSVDGGGGAAKNGRPNAGKAFINNNLLNVDRELKKNKKQEDYGFIPSSWKLVRLAKDGTEDVEIASGVADFCLVEEDGKKTFVYTNGKHIFSVREGEKRKKLADTDFCLKVGSLYSADSSDSELYDFF